MSLPLRFIGNPVLSLQTMLRTLSFQYPVLPQLIPSGIFDENTLEAVMIFQREFFPPVTGRVDNGTWDAIVARFLSALDALSEPQALNAFPSRLFTVAPGEESVHMNLVQAMFKSLSQLLDEVEDCEVSGVHDGPSVNNVRWLQRLGGCPETGVLDKCAWDALSRLYAIFVAGAQSPWLTRPQVLTAPGPHRRGGPASPKKST